jgi:hypothetical protein
MKYQILYNDRITVKGRTLYRIKALQDINNKVRAGDLGGYIESEANLTQIGSAWVHKGARVYGNIYIFNGVQIYGPVRAV